MPCSVTSPPTTSSVRPLCRTLHKSCFHRWSDSRMRCEPHPFISEVCILPIRSVAEVRPMIPYGSEGSQPLRDIVPASDHPTASLLQVFAKAFVYGLHHLLNDKSPQFIQLARQSVLKDPIRSRIHRVVHHFQHTQESG